MIKAILSLVLILSGIGILLQPAHATTFEETGFRLTHSPTICALGPEPNSLIPNLESRLFSETEYSILDWKTKLSNGVRHPVYDMTLVRVPFSQTFDSSKCDIQISYLPSPTNTPDSKEPVGYTQYDFENHKAKIVIYYLQLVFSLTDQETRDSNYIYHNYIPVSQYYNRLAPDSQLRMTFDHEFGHAFGLSHYAIPDSEINDIESGKEFEVPSIMVPVVVPTGNTHYSINPIDIQQLKSLYGESGFKSPVSPKVSQTSQPTPQPSSSEYPIILKTDKTSYKNGDSITVSGTVTNSSPLDKRLIFMYIFDPAGKNVTPLFGETSGQQFTWMESSTVVSSWTIDGTYTVQARAIDPTKNQVILAGETTFSFSKTSTTSEVPSYQEWPAKSVLKGEMDNGYDYKQVLSDLFSYFNKNKLISGDYIYESPWNVQMPSWLMKDLKLWLNNEISDNDLAGAIEYSHNKGLLTFHNNSCEGYSQCSKPTWTEADKPWFR